MLNDKTEYPILFIETGGTISGGSFEMLYQHLRFLDRQKYRPVVVFINKNHYAELIRKMDISVYILTDYLLSKHVNRFLTLILHKLSRFIEIFTPYLYLPYIRFIKAPLIYKICRLIKKNNIELIHLHTQLHRDLFGVFAAKKMKVPCISHLRSNRSHGFEARRARFCNQFITSYLAISKGIKNHWINLGLDKNKTKILYDGIIISSIKPANIRKDWNIGDEVKYIIGCVGRLSWEKGHIFLLNAFALFSKMMPDTVLVIVGDGDIKKELEQNAYDLGLREKIIFTGYQLNASDMTAAFDLLIVPSKEEPFGLVVIEGMRAGTPVIGTNAGGIPDIIEHNRNGMLIEYNDVEALSEAMKKLLIDEQLRSKVTSKGFETVKERFSIERYASELDIVYAKTLELQGFIDS